MSIIVPGRPNLTHTLCFMFSGKAGVGKSYCSNILMDIGNFYKVKSGKFPFAFGVKATATFMGWDGKKDQRGRKLLQTIGQGGRAYNPYIWAHSTFVRIEESVGYPYDIILIDDWRFRNEIEYITKVQSLYKPIKIRISAPNREILVGTPEYDEISETELDEYSFDYVVNNSADGRYMVETELLKIFLSETLKHTVA